MLTRSQVARRLGRSLATVRRLEGKELHPERDARGVHRFDPLEVAALGDRLTTSGSLLAAAASDPDDEQHNRWDETHRLAELTAEVDRLASQLSEAQRTARRATRDLERFTKRTADVLSSLGHELMDVDPALGDVVVAAMHELAD